MPLFFAPPDPGPLFTAGQFARAVESAPPGKLRLRALLRLDRWDEALAEAERLARLSPSDSDTLGLLALARLRAGRPEDAEIAAKKAGESGYWGLIARAWLLSIWRDDDKAAAPLAQKAVRLRPNEPEGWWLWLNVSQSEEEAGAALQALQRLKPKGHPFDETSGEYEQMGRSLAALRDSRREMRRRKNQIVLPERARIPFESVMGMIFVTVKIDGKPLRLLFDTGAGTALLVDRDKARKLSAKFLTQTIIRGVQGKESARMLRPRSVTLGPLRFGPLPLREGSDMPYCDGLFGGALLSDYAVTVDFSERVLRLRKVKSGAPPPKTGVALPFKQLFGGNLYVPLTLTSPGPKERGFALHAPLWAIVDTGAQTGLLSRRLAGALALGLPEGSVQTMENAASVGVGKTKSTMRMDIVQRPFSLLGPGGLVHPVQYGIGASPLDEVISPGTNFETGALLGMPFLMRYRKVTFDYPNSRLILEGAPDSSPVTATADPLRDPQKAPAAAPREGSLWIFTTDSGWSQVPASFTPKGVRTVPPFTIAPGYTAYKIDKTDWTLLPETK